MNEPAQHPYRFTLLNGPRQGEVITLQLGETKIGRSSRLNDIVIEDPTVSREHARLNITDREVIVEDLGSSHGSSINGVPLKKPSALNHNDLLQLGEQKMKFERLAQASAPAAGTMEKTSFAPGAGEEVEESGTRFMPAKEDAKPEEKYEATRVFQAEGTRMLSPEELAGLKPGGQRGMAPRTRLIAGGALAAAIVIVGAVLVIMHPWAEESVKDSGPIKFRDPQYDYFISRPSPWRHDTGAQKVAVHFNARDARGRPAGGVDVYGDKSREYGVLGLTMGFENCIPSLKSRHQGFSLVGAKQMFIQDTKVIFFGFTTRDERGKAIYTQDGDVQLVVECMSPKNLYPSVAQSFTDLLQSFGFAHRQRCIDYPKPDEAQRKLAITDPPRLIAQAQQDDKVGQDLFHLKGVRPENLYNAIKQFQLAMQKASALGTRPPFFAETAQRLKDATAQFDDFVRDQWFKITAAAKQQDLETARLEAARLMMMVPDKRDPLYQDAQDAVRKYTPDQ